MFIEINVHVNFHSLQIVCHLMKKHQVVSNYKYTWEILSTLFNILTQKKHIMQLFTK